MADDPFQITFNVSREKADQRLVAFDCDTVGIPPEAGLQSTIADSVVQLLKSETHRACVSMNEGNTLQPPSKRFLYMDVGAWCNGKQTFGLVCGNQAMICSYVSAGPQSPAGGGNNQGLLDDFVASIPGVSVLCPKTVIAGPHPADANQLYIIIPDMHVAEPVQDAVARPVTGEQGNTRDLFHSANHVADLAQFLETLQTWGSIGSSILVQVGDMYELWAGRDCYFQDLDQPIVQLVPDSGECYQGGGGTCVSYTRSPQIIGGMVADTHRKIPWLFLAFENLKAREKIFLHGNHDSYFGWRLQGGPDKNTIPDNANNSLAIIPPASPTGKVFDRVMPAIRDGLFIEHGQRCDGANRDGARFGYNRVHDAVEPGWFARQVGKVVDLDKFDSVRRKTFVTGAASHWVSNNCSYGLYVMGHTHVPVLNFVEVVVKEWTEAEIREKIRKQQQQSVGFGPKY